MPRRRILQWGLAAVAASAGVARANAASTRVVLLLSGSTDDVGWGQLAHRGIVALQRDPGMQASFVEHVPRAQLRPLALRYAQEGYDLVIGHGYEFADPLLDIAPAHPRTRFLVTSFLPRPDVPANTLFVDLAYVDVAFCAGALAALISPGGKAVGFVGGDDNATQQRMRKAFVLGAGHARPGVQGLGILTGDYASAAKGRQAATTLIGQGADVLWHAANETGLGALQAAAAAKVKALGCYSDQSAVAPQVLGTSFLMRLDRLVQGTAQAVAQGRFAGGRELRPTLSQIWSCRAGAHGDYNPAIVSAPAWARFQEIWDSVAGATVEVRTLLR